jgi:hypothetical protein
VDWSITWSAQSNKLIVMTRNGGCKGAVDETYMLVSKQATLPRYPSQLHDPAWEAVQRHLIHSELEGVAETTEDGDSDG